MKITKDFTMQVPKNRYNTTTGRYDLLGTFQIDGKAYCQHPKDTESYDYDIERVLFNPAGTEDKEDCTKAISALILIDEAYFHDEIMAYMVYLFGGEAEDHTTDSRQDFPSLLEVFGGMFNPNQMRA